MSADATRRSRYRYPDGRPRYGDVDYVRLLRLARTADSYLTTPSRDRALKAKRRKALEAAVALAKMDVEPAIAELERGDADLEAALAEHRKSQEPAPAPAEGG